MSGLLGEQGLFGNALPRTWGTGQSGGGLADQAQASRGRAGPNVSGSWG